METHKTKGNEYGQMMFKSYYVVWKQIWRKYMSGWSTMFKSYYVVWKLEYFVDENKYNIGLNRTM